MDMFHFRCLYFLAILQCLLVKYYSVRQMISQTAMVNLGRRRLNDLSPTTQAVHDSRKLTFASQMPNSLLIASSLSLYLPSTLYITSRQLISFMKHRSFLPALSILPNASRFTWKIQAPLNPYTPHLISGQCWRPALMPFLSLVLQRKEM